MFDVEKFSENPSAFALTDLTKAQWSELARHYGIAVPSSYRKQAICDLVLDKLTELSILSKEEINSAFKNQSNFSDADYHATRNELEQLRRENDRLTLLTSNVNSFPSEFKLNAAIKFVPKFNEEKPECFFTHFERTAQLHSWPRDKWVLLVDSVFVGRAQEVFSAIDVTCVNDYDYVKKAVLNVYKKVPEAYRQEFRDYRRASKQSYVEFIRQKQLLSRKWVESELLIFDYESLLELFILEDVKNNMPLRIRAHIEERGLRQLTEIGPAADHYALTNPYSNPRSRESTASHSDQVKEPSSGGSRVDQKVAQQPNSQTSRGGETSDPGARKVFCRYCKKPDHEISQCPKLANKRSPVTGETVLNVTNA